MISCNDTQVLVMADVTDAVASVTCEVAEAINLVADATNVMTDPTGVLADKAKGKRKKKVRNYGIAPPQLDPTDTALAIELGLLRSDLPIEALDASSPSYAYAYDKQRNVGTFSAGTQQEIQQHWRVFARRAGFQLFVAGNSTKKNYSGNASYGCKKLNGQQYFDQGTPSAHLQCPFLVQVYGLDGEWKTTAINLSHNHIKHVGFTQRPLVEAKIVATGKQKRNRGYTPSELSALVVRGLLPGHNYSTKTITGEAMKKFLFENTGVDPPLSTVSRTKQDVENNLRGDRLRNYQQLESYLEILSRENEGSTWCFEKDESHCFKRACYIPNAAGHIVPRCKQILGFDGAHLKGEMHKAGVFLVATAKDYNDRIIPFGLALVSVENFENWKWFLEHVKTALPSMTRFTALSDRDKGLKAAVEKTFPDAGHRYCLFHIMQNITRKGISLGDDEHKLICKMARSDCENDYRYYESELKLKRPTAAEYLATIDQDHWVKYRFQEKYHLPTYDEITSNLAEQANNWIGDKCRSSKPLDAFGEFARRFNLLLTKRRNEIGELLKHGDCNRLVPKRESELRERLKNSATSTCDGCGASGYSVQYLGPALTTRETHPWRFVDLIGRTCTCGNWMDEDFPCVHSLRACVVEGDPISSLYDAERLSLTSYMETYTVSFRPWPISVALKTDSTLRLRLVEAEGNKKGSRGQKPGPKPKNKRLKSKGCT